MFVIQTDVDLCSSSSNYSQVDLNMTERPNILVVCGKNKKRSRTAEFIFKNDNRFNIRSAGLSEKSDKKLSEIDLNWADLVLVKEQKQKDKIMEIYKHIALPAIKNLNIADDYEFMDNELIEILNDTIDEILKIGFNI